MSFVHLLGAGFALAVVLVQLSSCEGVNYDVVVFGATAGGVMAATAAANAGMSTALLCNTWPDCFPPAYRIGGMTAGGLGQTDTGNTKVIGGMALQFYEDSAATYSTPQPKSPFNLEPHVALRLLHKYLNDSGVDLFYECALDKVDVTGTTIKTAYTKDGRNFSALAFVDTSYEGDLYAAAGATFRIGRESVAEFNESLAGNRMQAGVHYGNGFDVVVDPFDTNGIPLPHITTTVPGAPGEGDNHVPAYNFRLCVTQNTSNMIPFPKPDDYNPDEWELLRRFVNASSSYPIPSGNCRPVPLGKFDMNNGGGLSTDYIGASWTFPNASFEERQVIWQAHKSYQQGLMWSLSHDPAIPEATRTKMQSWGLCKDEFVETNGWPPALYVRESRRLVGDRIFTQNTPHLQHEEGTIGNMSVGLGSYNFDSHNTQRIACYNESYCGAGVKGVQPGVPYAWNEGDVEIGPGVYEIPYWVLLPKQAELTNILVAGMPSATHIGISTLRLEPQFMILGQSSGVWAALQVKESQGKVVNMHSVDLAVLHAKLLAGGQKLNINVTNDCIGGYCIRSSQGTCDMTCSNTSCSNKYLTATQWLALKLYWDVSGESAKATRSTFLKKSVDYSADLPSSMVRSISSGTTVALTAPPTELNTDYLLFELTM